MNTLVTVETLTPAIVFAPGGVEGIVSKLEAEVRAIPRDMATDEGRKAIASLAYKVARSKTALDDMGKDLVADIKKQSGAIDAERRIIRDRLDALRDEVRAPLTAWESAENERVAGHEGALVTIIEWGGIIGADTPIEAIRARIGNIEGVLSERDWQEFSERASAAIAEAIPKLQAALAAAIQREADAAELAELRRMKAEREAADARAAIEAAHEERARNAKAAAEALAAERAAAFAAHEIERAAQAQRDQEAAAARAIEQERQRVAAEAAAAQAKADKLAANKRHRAKVHAEIATALSLIIGEHSDAAGPAAVAAADSIIEAISAGRIPHTSITY